MKKILSLLLSAAMILTMASGSIATAAQTEPAGNVISAWENPEVTAKPAARCWFPDAGAGADFNQDGKPDYLDQVYDYIIAMYEGGFGSVELTWLNTNTFFDEEYASEIGWGTPAYNAIICTALDAANHCEDGFQIDITITAHWPITINSVTPNDAAAAQSIVLADQQPLTAEALTQDVLPLQMAETWLCDNANSASGKTTSDSTYIFKDTLISTALAKLNDDGTINMDSLVTLGTGEDLDATGSNISTVDSWAVGIPGEDVAYIEFVEDETGHKSWNLLAEAPQGAVRNVSGTNSLVQNDDYYDNRPLMADTQVEYGVSTSAIKEAIGDDDPASYVLLNSYYRGSGETCSGGATQMMEGKAYVTDYFSAAGADVVLDYWEENMLPYEYTTVDGEKTTMAELMKENVAKCGGSSIFEDSIELNPKYTGGKTFWTANALKDFEETYGYDVSKYVYVMMDSGSSDNADEASLIYNDFAQMMGDLYVQHHSSYINSYFSEEIGYKYRAQAYELDGMLDVGLAAMSCGFGESDNSTSKDADRLLAGANLLSGSLYTTNEALTFGYDEYQVWRTELQAMNNLFSEGVSHIILHGSAFNRASPLNEAASAWPGWNFRMAFNAGKVYTNGFMSWGPRQPHWQDEDTLSNYVARVQTLLQMGQQKTNVAYISDHTKDTGFNGSTAFQTLLDSGYTYTPLTHGEVESEYVSLNADGTVSNLGFKAIILNKVETTTVETMQKLAEFAQNGILIINTNAATSGGGGGFPGGGPASEPGTGSDGDDAIVYPSKVMGTDYDGSSAAAIAESFEDIKASGNYKECTTQEEILSALQSQYTAGIRYDISGLQMTEVHDESDSTTYFMLYNAGKSDIENESITIAAPGALYCMDPAYGSVTALAEGTDYVENADGSVTVTNFDLQMGSIIVYAASNSGYIQSISTPSVVKTPVGTIDLGGDHAWTVDLESWGPDDEANTDRDTDGDGVIDFFGNPTASKKTTIKGLDATLGTWSKDNALGLTDEDLAVLGVAETKDISGIGTYTTTFEVPAEMQAEGSELGAVLNVGFNADDSLIASINVNGTDLIIDPLKDYVDIGNVLRTGENIITIKYTTSLSNRVASIYGAQSSMFGGGAAFCDDGLEAVSLDLYNTEKEPDVLSASAPESAQVNSPFVVTVVTSGSVTDVRLANENEMLLKASATEVTENEDGTKTWELTMSVGTVGNGRTFKVVTKGAEGYFIGSDVEVSLDITSVPATISSFEMPEEAVANRTFIVRATTDTTATKINVYNEYGLKMVVSSLSYKDVDGVRQWTGVMSIGTKGTRSFNAYAVNKFGAMSEVPATDAITVKAYA